MTSRTIIKTDALKRLDEMPWTGFHTLLTVALGVGWTLDSFEINIIGSVFGTIQSLWHLNSDQSSLAVSVWVLGILVGAIAFGYLSDRFGRKRLFLVTLLWYAVFSVGAVFAWNYTSFLFFRAMTAFAVGGEYSAVTATMSEFIPRRNRGRTDSLILSSFPLGALLSAAVAYFALKALPPDIAWRVGFGLGTSMALIFFWIRRVIPESPRWLLQQGRVEEAEAIVEKIAGYAKSEGGSLAVDAAKRYDPVVMVPAHPAFWRNMKELFGAYRVQTALAGLLNFSQATVVYGVLSLMALVILPYLKVPAASMPIYYIYGNIAALLGALMASRTLETLGRRISLLLSYSFTVVAILALYWANSQFAMVLGYCLIQFGVTWGYISAYVVSGEILPTRLRATGLGLSVAFGRVGAMLTPLLLVKAFAATGTPSAPLLVLLLLALPGPIVAAFWALKGRETRNISLEAGSDDALVAATSR